MILDISYSQRTKAHTLPSRTSRHTSQNLAKSVLFPTQKEIQFFFSFPLEKIKTPDTQTDTTKTVKLNKDNGLQPRWTRTPAPNSTYKKLAVQWLNEVQFFNQTFVQVDSFVLRNRQLLIAAKRYRQGLGLACS
jgi:hypothetical protein